MEFLSPRLRESKLKNITALIYNKQTKLLMASRKIWSSAIIHDAVTDVSSTKDEISLTYGTHRHSWPDPHAIISST